MNAPFFGISLGFSLGIVAEHWIKIPIVPVFIFSGAGIIALWFLRGRKLFLPLFILLMGCAGTLATRLDAVVPANDVRRFVGSGRVALTGTVSSLPEVKTRGKRVSVSLILRAGALTESEKGRYRKIPVKGQVQVFLIQLPFVPQVGDELRLYGTLDLPRKVLNPGEFDYGQFLGQKDIYTIFQTIGPKSVKRLREGARLSPARLLADARKSLAALIDRLYATPEAAIMKALVLGLRSDISPEVRDQFMKTGTVHLFATANTKRDFAPFSNKIIATYSP